MTQIDKLINERVPIERLSRDLRIASKTLSDKEARFLVDGYYIIQENRIRADAQIRSMSVDGEPIAILDWTARQMRTLENQIKGALDKYSASHPIGEWLRAQKGIGPVLASGLLAHIDIERCPTVGHIYSFAGLVPGVKWEKGKKRPWNASLKTLCWKIGESFVKFSNHDDALYGKIYAESKEYLVKRNEAGEFAEDARRILESLNFSKSTVSYKYYAGIMPNQTVPMLPPAHIHARAKRRAVKIFLSHFHQVWYEQHFGRPAPEIYPIAYMGHVHKIEPPR